MIVTRESFFQYRIDGIVLINRFRGRLQITVNGEPHILEPGDSFSFDSSQPHALESPVERSRMVAVIYNSESMLYSTKGRRMKSLIEAARLPERRTVVGICPDKVSLSAVNKAIQIIYREFGAGIWSAN